MPECPTSDRCPFTPCRPVDANDVCVMPPVVTSPRGRLGLVILTVCAGIGMFGLGAAAALFQHGIALPVFARQAPEGVDRVIPNQRSIRSIVEQREEQQLHGTSEQADPSESLPSVAPLPSSAPVPQEPLPEDTPALEPEADIPVNEESDLQHPEEPVVPDSVVPQEEEMTPVPVVPEVVPAGSPEPLPHGEIGVFFTQGSVRNEKYFLATLDRLSALTGSALIFNVKAGTVHFHSAAPMADELDLIAPAYDLPEVIAQARARGVTTIGRFVALKDPNLARALPATQIRHPKTGRSVGNVWVDASHPDVLAHNEQVLRELVQAGIDEINLDYIRYPTEYAPASIGLTGSEKADRIEQFLLMARRVIDEEGAQTKLGISTYAILGWNFPVNFEPLGQDIARFASLVDVISPMAYPATFAPGSYYNPAKHPRSRMYYLVYRTLTGYAELLGDDAWKIRPWIQGYGITQKNLQDQIDAVFDAGFCGFTLWNASNEYGTFMKLLPQVRRPQSCDIRNNLH